MNNESELQDSLRCYYDQENKRRSEWLDTTCRNLIPEMLYLKWKSMEDKTQIEEMMRSWMRDEKYKIEISPDNILIQIWKGNEQVAQYQTILPEFVKFLDGESLSVRSSLN